MFRKPFAWLIFLVTLFSFTLLPRQPVSASEEECSLQPTDGINIPVFSIETMNTYSIPDNDAMAFLRDMKAGWNLGNTFDAYSNYTSHVTGSDMESSWVGTKTRRSLIEAVHDAGFNTIRMPVSWHNHVDADYNIDHEWMERVKQVAGFALDLDMYVIINVHHDNDKHFFYPDEAHFEQSSAYLSAVWTQMADAFRDYDDHLILESLNEPRLVGTQFEWSWQESNALCREAADCINRLNQLFVDIVRSTGGNNATRYLAVPAYDGSPWYACSNQFILPEDTAENRIVVEAHAYTPYDFALNKDKPGDRTFDLQKDIAKKREIDSFLDALYKRFIINGIPVIMDEFGALDKDGNLQDRVNFTAYYVASASARGITCVWWDNNCFTGSGERFGLIRRVSSEWAYPDIAIAMIRNCLFNRR